MNQEQQPVRNGLGNACASTPYRFAAGGFLPIVILLVGFVLNGVLTILRFGWLSAAAAGLCLAGAIVVYLRSFKGLRRQKSH